MTYDTVPEGYVAAKDLAEELGLRPGPLREWVNRNATDEEMARIRRPGGGTVLYVSPAVAEAARVRHRTTTHVVVPASQPVDQAVLAEDDAVPYDAAQAEGWRLALAEAQANARRLEADLATAKAERDTARVEAQAAIRQAAEAERGQNAALARVDGLRAAWWRWRLQLETLGPLARLRKRWPVEPPEIEQPPLLTGPKG